MNRIKELFYFPIASYFAFFARIVLLRWKPRIVVITGSSGKTTLLHMLASQFGDRADYSFHANSAFGIPFHILGIKRKTLTLFEWPYIFLSAPFRIFRQLPKQNIFIVEADCDRPNEGKFLSKLLKPEIVLWISLARTHSMNFENLIKNGIYNTLEKAIAYEFGYFVESATNFVITNSDNSNITNELCRSKCRKIDIHLKDFNYKYNVTVGKTRFEIDKKLYVFNYLLPKEIFYDIVMTKKITEYFNIPFDQNFTKFELPAGRSSFFEGVKKTILVDSSYNANLDSMKVILNMFSQIKTVGQKWIVIGDMLEQGLNERVEHKLLGQEINKYRFDKIIFMGPRVIKYTKPVVSKKSFSFETPDLVLNFLNSEIKGGETILFKGARFLEGVIENLLFDKKDAEKLVRREQVWVNRRRKFGL